MSGEPYGMQGSRARSPYGRLYQRWLYPTFDRVIKKRKTVDYWRRAEVTQWWSPERLESHQLDCLRSLLQHAQSTCRFYRDLWRHYECNPSSLQSLQDFSAWPLLERQTVRECADVIRSCKPLQRIPKATGGSTGRPLQFELDEESNQRRTAMTHRGYSWAGAAPGSKQLYLWGSQTGTVSLVRRIKTQLHRRFDHQRYLNCFDLCPRRMQKYLAILNRHRPETIIAYSNPLYEFARYLCRKSLVPFSPDSIVVGAEKLHDFQRDLIERTFRCPVFETYGSREFMLIGAECERREGLHLSMENLLVEVLDENGRPTNDGEEGNVVITDLFNYAMPFIRYVTGDRAVAGFSQCSCGRGLPLLRSVVGRQADMLRTAEGKIIPGLFFPHLLKDFPQVRRYQVIQDQQLAIRLRLILDQDLSPTQYEQLMTEVRRCVGERCPFEIEFVDHIELTAAGKHRVVVRAA